MVRRLIRLVSVITNHQSRTPHLSLHYVTQTCVNPAVPIPLDIRTRRLFRIRLRMGSYLTVVLNTKGCNRFTLVIIPCCMPKVPARVILNTLTVSRSVGRCDPADHRRPPSLVGLMNHQKPDGSLNKNWAQGKYTLLANGKYILAVIKAYSCHFILLLYHKFVVIASNLG